MAFDPVTRTEDARVEEGGEGAWQSSYRVLTPQMRELGVTRLGVVENTLPPGSVGCPFHWHAREDEVFYVLRGRGVLRYGDTVREVGPGDCISCPAGTQIAHQLANPFDEPFVYLGIGPWDPHEVCGYPDTGKIMVRALKAVGDLERRPYMEREPEPPVIFGLWKADHR